MEYYNNIMCVTFGELTFGDNPIIGINTLKALLFRDRVERVRRAGGEGSRALINYSTLPEKYRRLYEERYGNPAAIC